MTYFIEVTGYQTYANADADFHFSYNANSGGGQSFLGGMFANDKGELTSPTVLDGYVGIFKFVYKNANGKEIELLLDDINGKYEIKPRGTGSTSMKLSVGTKLESPSKLISSLFMLPPTCAIKNPANLDVSILSSNNFWLQSMWLKCDISDASKQVNLIPKDFVFCGGSNKDKQGNDRYFKLEAEKRIIDVISLSEDVERLPKEFVQYVSLFSDIYLGKVPFDYEGCVNATKQIMVLLAKEYPAEYSGIEDPLPFLKSLIARSSTKNKKNEASLSGKYNVYLAALRTKPFMLLAGISGTGKSRIVRKLAQASVTEDLQKLYDPKSIEKGFNRWQLHKPANFELVQVKPNWHNSLEVVGYKSNIGSPHYEFTPFVEFVARAWKHQNIPFFLCLDEMNLAPVEQYFAEFLSAIESRSIENGEYETDPIIKPFSEFDTRDDNGNVTDKLSDRMIAKLIGKLDTQAKSDLADRFRTKGLTLPKNLLVLGTVNMDETTFSFSRKVLDRAMSIVMNNVEYDKFFTGETENDMAELNDATKELLIDRPIRGLEAEDNGAEQVEQYLTAINEVLNDTPFKLGYRAANEALLYVSAAHQFDGSIDVNAALDEFTLMKILSRIEGDKRSIGNLLKDLQSVINGSYPASNKKLIQMANTLQDKQFVSYWT